MKRLVITAATLLALSLTPAMAAGCCGKGGKGMCAKPDGVDVDEGRQEGLLLRGHGQEDGDVRRLGRVLGSGPDGPGLNARPGLSCEVREVRASLGRHWNDRPARSWRSPGWR